MRVQKPALPGFAVTFLNIFQPFSCLLQNLYILKSAAHQTSFRRHSRELSNLEKHHGSDEIKGGNTMKKLGLLAIVAALVVGFSWAQDDSSTDTSTAATESTSVDFMSYDADGDGILTADELGQGLLAAYDSNADGSVDQTEFDAMAGMMGGGMSDTSTDSTADSSTDSSTDTSTATSGMLGDFTSFDVSADGTLDAQELGQGFLLAYDVNADSSLDATELASISGSTPTQ
jgi:hypothetical protein